MKTNPPGILRREADPDVIMMICTAGHVDHGKTSLVRLLTGCNTDRLKAEQERGMTIELGFAPCTLPGNRCIGIVDVPGHERFIRNMVAGVSGIDLTILVVAADDGIMPQTIEHLDIMKLLGVRHGIIALTKTDLATPARIAEVTASLRTFTQATFLENAPICPLSCETGEGVFDFYDTLTATIDKLQKTRQQGIFRMPIERIFSSKGFGVVVTGIPVSGAIQTGAPVELMPGGQTGKIRGIQRFLRNAGQGSQGQCLALNIPEFSKNLPERGQVLTEPGFLHPVSHIYARIHTVSTLESPIPHAAAIRLHTGAVEAMGKIFILAAKELPPSATSFVHIALREPIAAAPHDRLIIRRPSPAATLGGGEILFARETPLPWRKERILDELTQYAARFQHTSPTSPEGLKQRIGYTLQTWHTAEASIPTLARETLTPEAHVREAIEDIPAIRRLDPNTVIHETQYQRYQQLLQQAVEQAARARNLSIPVADLRKQLPGQSNILWTRLIEDLEKAQALSLRNHRILVHAAAEHMTPQDRQIMTRLIDLYNEAGFHSPRPDELPGLLQAPLTQIERILTGLCDQGLLFRIAKNVVLSYDAIKEAQTKAVEIMMQQGKLDSADFKYTINSTRKYALAILDYLDARRITLRFDNERRLAAGYQKRLIP